MKHLLFLGLLLSPAFAQSNLLSDAHLTFTLSNTATVVTDVTGIYGSAGQRLVLKDLVADLHGSGGMVDIESDSIAVFVPYRLSYTLADEQTGATVASDYIDLHFYQNGTRGDHRVDMSGSSDLLNPPAFNGKLFGQKIGGDMLPYPLWNNGYAGAHYTTRYWWDEYSLVQGTRLYTNASGSNANKYHIFTIAPQFGGGYVYATASGYIEVGSIPEPETYAMLAMGLTVVALARMKK